MTIKLGYARVSTANQNTENQQKQLTEAGCSELFVDWAVSGSKNHESPEYVALFARVKELREQGAEVMVCVVKLDRFSRSLKDLLEGVEELGKLGASFTALSDSFTYDANSPMSKLILSMLGSLAEFERSMITGRMQEGLEAKVAKGLIRGQKPKLRSSAVKAICAAYAAGDTTPGALAKEWGVSRFTIIRVLGLPGSTKPYVTLDEWEKAKELANA